MVHKLFKEEACIFQNYLFYPLEKRLKFVNFAPYIKFHSNSG